MKPLLTLLLVLIISSCAPLTRMNYSISLCDHGNVLCRDYQIRADTIFLYDTQLPGWRRYTDSQAVGFKHYLITDIR